jgi:hypothetical protein
LFITNIIVFTILVIPEEEEEVLFIGTQFSNLSTAVDASAAAACNCLKMVRLFLIVSYYCHPFLEVCTVFLTS